MSGLPPFAYPLLWHIDELGQVKCGQHVTLVAPYCAIPRDYLSDTPLLRAMGLLVSQHGELGAIPRPPFLSVSPLESMRSGGAIPPPQKGYLSDTCAIPYENKANGCDTPSAILSRKGIARYGGVSRTGPLSTSQVHTTDTSCEQRTFQSVSLSSLLIPYLKLR